jgi:small subunit ribosomal protein S20
MHDGQSQYARRLLSTACTYLIRATWFDSARERLLLCVSDRHWREARKSTQETGMANIKSQKKRIITNEKRRQRNVAVKSRLRSYMKLALAAIEAKDMEQVKAVLPQALSEIDRAASKGVIHPNSAARKKSTLQRQAAAL